MRRHHVDRLLGFSSRLQGVSTFETLLELVCAEVQETIGYRTVWVAVLEPDGLSARILMQQGADVWDEAQAIPIAGDVHLERVVTSLAPVVVVDAQTDPDVNREIVEALGNRTIVHVPMTFIDVAFGALGMGTYGDEGVHVPTDEELEFLQGLASQIVVASSRIILLREREQAARERGELERMLAERQRLESLGQLAGGIAHDFNNLLSAILGAASLLRSDETDESRIEDLRLIEDAAGRASELTSRLLALGKRQTLRIIPTDANQTVRHVLALVRRVIRSDIAIELVEGDDLPAILGDGSQLEQVFMNLCLNARDAMPDGGQLSIVTERVDLTDAFGEVHPWARPGRYVLISVTDNGSGMTAEVLERAFEPFFTTKEEGRGTGLGLAVSRGIVEQHGGLVHGYSEPGVGTTFKIYLPVADRAVAEGGTTIEPPVRSGHERILVADDQRFVRDIVDRVLTRSGYSVAVVEDGAAAVEHVRANPVDLVILDAVMPGLGGREAYVKIHELQPDLPVLFASGYGGDELTTRFLADTEVPLLLKPFDPDMLLRAVRDLLDEAAGTP
jgi:signal transduction histidine kinase